MRLNRFLLGYIKAKKFISDGVFEAEKFVEKPSKQLAQNYIKSENYFWNSGIFIFDVNFMLKQVENIQNIYINKFLLLLQILQKI